MKTNLERYQEVLIKIANIRNDCGCTLVCHCDEENSLKILRDEVISMAKQVLNPPPEYEEVEESLGWVNIYRNRVSHINSSRESANDAAAEDRLDCQEIKVKVKRPKPRMVERRVEAEAKNENSYSGRFDTYTIGLLTPVPLGTKGHFVWYEEEK